VIQIGLHSGGRMTVTDSTADVSQVTPHDLAYGLAHVTRFGGQAGAYSVAEHSVRLYDWLLARGYTPSTRLAALLHDAPECLGEGDHQRFVKRAFFGDGPARYADMVCTALWAKFRRTPSCSGAIRHDIIKPFDARLGEAEGHAFGLLTRAAPDDEADVFAPSRRVRYSARTVIAEYLKRWEAVT